VAATLLYIPLLHIPGMGKLVQQKSHGQKAKTSEPQNQFVLSNTVCQRMQVSRKMIYIKLRRLLGN